MPINFNEPTATQNMTTQMLPSITQAFAALAQMLDPAVAGTLTNTPTGAYRINGVNLERFNGTTWGTYTLNIAGSATQVGGLAPATASATPGANQLVRTDANSQTWVGTVNMNRANDEIATPAQFVITNGTDNYLRKSSAAQAMSAIRTAASGSWGISITGTAGSVAWTSVTGRPTALSAFTNDSGYITSATTVAGLAPSASGATVGVNELVRSDASGNTFLNRFSTAVANANIATPAQFLTTVGTDNIVGKSSAAQAMAVIRTAASGSWGISITGNAATASSVAWTSVTGRPTAVSALTNDSGYLNAAGLVALNQGTNVGALRFLINVSTSPVDVGGAGSPSIGSTLSSTALRSAHPPGWTLFQGGNQYYVGGVAGTPASDLPAGQTWLVMSSCYNPYTAGDPVTTTITRMWVMRIS